MKKNRIKYNCDYCGKECEVQVSRYNMSKGRHYCNRDCYWAYNRGKNHHKYTALNIECDYCGKLIEVGQYSMKHRRNHFCNKICTDKYKIGIKGAQHPNYKQREVECSDCGAVLLRPPSEISKRKDFYCGRECVGKHRSRVLIGEKHPSWKGGLIKATCSQCGESFEMKAHRLRDNNFCNQKCLGQWLSENHSGKNSWLWKGGMNIQNTIRKSTRMKEWIRAVFERDGFVCQKCNEGNNNLNGHHLNSVAKMLRDYNIQTIEDALACDELWDLDNGVTLCNEHHKEFHREYGVRKFTRENYYEWIKQEELICQA